MQDTIRFMLNRIQEKLWLKPLIFCLISILAALLARMADGIPNSEQVINLIPSVTKDSIEDLLKITAASMLVIATLAVASMVSAYASASSTATPRSLSLIIADDVSQNALSTFIGVFIFSVVGLVALQNGYYEKLGLLSLFVLTLIALAMVIVTFLRWVDRIARLGRMGSVIKKVEQATSDALLRRARQPSMQGAILASGEIKGVAIYAKKIGYVQRVDISKLQALAEQQKIHISVTALPGSFVAPDRAIAFVNNDLDHKASQLDSEHISKAFIMGDERLFDNDPRFGLIVLSEIASRALSPAVNDPGTAIEVIGTLTRLFWQYFKTQPAKDETYYDRVQVPELLIDDLFDDAFTPIARDSAGLVEVQLRLQKALLSLATGGAEKVNQAAFRHAQRSFTQAEKALHLPEDIEAVKAAGLLTSNRQL